MVVMLDHGTIVEQERRSLLLSLQGKDDAALAHSASATDRAPVGAGGGL